MKTIIHENERGLLFKDGRFLGMLMPGKHYTLGAKQIEVVSLDAPLASRYADTATLLQNEAIAAATVTVQVGDEQVALHTVDGAFAGLLHSGTHTFWNAHHAHAFQLEDIASPDISDRVPAYIFAKLPVGDYVKVEVAEYQKARLYIDRKLARILDAGTYYFWRTPRKITVDYVDTRLTQMDITGQEILSADKVGLRINMVCHYTITDVIKVLTAIDNYTEQLHVAAQLALRDYVGRHTVDELLEGKDALSAYVLDTLRNKAHELYLEVHDAGIKDIILPGEIREIMNTVLVAQKRAQANVIMRREEVASTRSLLNTARLMDENATLYKLKELEYIERICENVGSITLDGRSDVLTQLAGILRGASRAS